MHHNINSINFHQMHKSTSWLTDQQVTINFEVYTSSISDIHKLAHIHSSIAKSIAN